MKNSQNRKFDIVIGSDLQRDGMYCELLEVKQSKKVYLGEIFFSDIDQSFLSSFNDINIPLDILEWFINTSKKRLIPKK
jgi:hypothetical protein